MTPARNARIAGFTFLLYIVAGIAGMIMYSRATGGVEIAAKLTNITQHLLQMRMTIVLGLLQAACALVLAVTLYAITRDEDPELAMLALAFRVGEGLLAAIPIRTSEAFSIWWGEGSRRRRGRGDRGWELWILNAAWVSCKCVWGEFWLPLVLIADGQLQDPFTIRPLGDADEGGFSAWLDAADALPRRRAWSKLAERLGADSHEESKPAR